MKLKASLTECSVLGGRLLIDRPQGDVKRLPANRLARRTTAASLVSREGMSGDFQII
jgi:hypothetical protein